MLSTHRSIKPVSFASGQFQATVMEVGVALLSMGGAGSSGTVRSTRSALPSMRRLRDGDVKACAGSCSRKGERGAAARPEASRAAFSAFSAAAALARKAAVDGSTRMSPLWSMVTELGSSSRRSFADLDRSKAAPLARSVASSCAQSMVTMADCLPLLGEPMPVTSTGTDA